MGGVNPTACMRAAFRRSRALTPLGQRPKNPLLAFAPKRSAPVTPQAGPRTGSNKAFLLLEHLDPSLAETAYFLSNAWLVLSQ